VRKPILTIFYQFNPWQSTIGGIQTLIRYYIKYAPPEFDIRLVGTGVDRDGALGRWYDCELEGRSIQFMPLFNVRDDDVRKIVPTSVRYTLALRGKNLASDFMHFHRLEPTLMTRHWPGEKTLFIHNDIHQQIDSPSTDKNAILWRRFPKAYFALERHLLGQFQQILSCNSESIELYRRQYPDWAERIQLVRNIVDDREFYPLPPVERERQRRDYAVQKKLPPNTRFLLFAGRLHPHYPRCSHSPPHCRARRTHGVRSSRNSEAEFNHLYFSFRRGRIARLSHPISTFQRSGSHQRLRRSSPGSA
jgi:glycosyltransferase involved in cell wall biosynthesis